MPKASPAPAPVPQQETTVVSSTTISTPPPIPVPEEPLTPREVTKALTIAGVFWDWFDQRDVEKHLVAIFTLYLTYMELTWGMHYAEIHATLPGSEIAMILAAIGVPLTALQTAVIGFYFSARKGV